MAWVLRLMLAGGALMALACGESSAPEAATEAATELTVLLPSGPDGNTQLDSFVTSFEYTVRCGSVELEGTLSKVDTFDGGPKGPTALWKGALDPIPGPCELTFIGRDDDGEAICPWTETLPGASEWPSELFFEAPCYQFYCTTTPLPDTVRKCFSVVGLVLSVRLPAGVGVDRVEYVISELTDFGAFIDDPLTAEAFRGELEVAGVDEADFGAGLVLAARWVTAIEGVVAGRYLVELTAFDADNTPRCVGERRVDVIADAVAQIEIAMPCIDTAENPP